MDQMRWQIVTRRRRTRGKRNECWHEDGEPPADERADVITNNNKNKEKKKAIGKEEASVAGSEWTGSQADIV